MTHTDRYLQETAEIVTRLDRDAIERIAAILAGIRAAGGRLFFLGVGGSAANCFACGQRLPQALPASRPTRPPTTSPS